MNRSLIPVALSATYTSAGFAFILNDTRHAGPDDANYKLSVDDSNDTSLGAGGTITSETAAVEAKKIIDDAGANGGTDQQMQAAAENTLPPGANTLDSDKKVEDGSDAGKKAIGDPPDSQTQQV